MPLKDIVLQIIDRVGGKRESVYGLKVANQCFRYELLELIRSDGTKVQFSKTDCEHPTVCAAPVNPAEAIWIEPREDGPHFVRRPATLPAPPAEPPQSPATTTPPADRLMTPAEESMPELPRVEPVSSSEPTAAADVGDPARAVTAAIETVKLPPKKRLGTTGRPREKRGPAAERMRADLRGQRLTPDELRSMKQEALAKRYDCKSRETACKARDDVLSEIVGNRVSDK
jgi:hypothetical protein